MPTIRWLGAFYRFGPLAESLNWELSRPVDGTPVCAERLQGISGMSRDIRIGLLVANKAIIRKYRSDVWSVPDRKNPRWLRAGRQEGEAWSVHSEVWVRPVYRGIVIRAGGEAIKPESLWTVKAAAEKFGLPIFKLNRRGQLLPIKLV